MFFKQLFHTIKRRKRYPFFWQPDKYRAFFDENLTPENETRFKDFLFSTQGKSPLRVEPWSSTDKWVPGVKRTGVLGKKLGQYYLWKKDGTRLLTTAVQVLDNHVISYQSPEEFQTLCRPFDKLRFKGHALVTVGSDSGDPRLFTAEYVGLFKESGVLPKKILCRFFINKEARLEPGTPLVASHFKPGMYVDVGGKTIEHGRQGVRDRFHLKLGQKGHGATKSHNRIGSIGRGRKECGPLKGRTMPGHHGGERRVLKNLKIWRVNTEHNVLWIHGPAVPGDIGSYIKIYDSQNKENIDFLTANPPPFPTISIEDNNKLSTDLYDDKLHDFAEPTLIFEETEEERKQSAIAAKRGRAKTAQKIK